jgi:hypothetical protein
MVTNYDNNKNSVAGMDGTCKSHERNYEYETLVGNPEGKAHSEDLGVPEE